MTRVEYMEDKNGNLIKALVSDKIFKTMSMSDIKTGERIMYALILTEEINQAIAFGSDSNK